MSEYPVSNRHTTLVRIVGANDGTTFTTIAFRHSDPNFLWYTESTVQAFRIVRAAVIQTLIDNDSKWTATYDEVRAFSVENEESNEVCEALFRCVSEGTEPTDSDLLLVGNALITFWYDHFGIDVQEDEAEITYEVD